MWMHSPPRRMLMSKWPLMTVHPFKVWAASTESMTGEVQNLSHGPLQAVQSMLSMTEADGNFSEIFYLASEHFNGFMLIWVPSHTLLFSEALTELCPKATFTMGLGNACSRDLSRWKIWVNVRECDFQASAFKTFTFRYHYACFQVRFRALRAKRVAIGELWL